ncbi:MAG TPA: cell division protein ZipA [Gammaproteobacteria bacterium]|nr:cell division protein ZipA [Gammaproteobacteria bacterium]
MWELRLILILIGVVFIAVVYLLSRQRKTRSGKLRRDPPTLKESNLPDIESDLAADLAMPSMRDSKVTRAAPEITHVNSGPRSEQLILALHVACREQTGFAGAEVLAALHSAGLHYGQYQVFHRLNNDGMQQSVFSVANMIEPGVLDPEILPEMRVPGVTLFLLLPGPQNGVAACADMLATARSLARQLDGDVLDDTHSILTIQAAQRIRERILEFQGRVSGVQS